MSSHHLHLRFTSIQAPNHDPLMVELANYLNKFFATSSKITNRLKTKYGLEKVTFEFPLCERNMFIVEKERQQNHQTEDKKSHGQEEGVSTTNSSSSSSTTCQIDVVGSIGEKNCSCGSSYLSWMH